MVHYVWSLLLSGLLHCLTLKIEHSISGVGSFPVLRMKRRPESTQLGPIGQTNLPQYFSHVTNGYEVQLGNVLWAGHLMVSNHFQN